MGKLCCCISHYDMVSSSNLGVFEEKVVPIPQVELRTWAKQQPRQTPLYPHLPKMTITINNSILAITGFILSAYSVYVEHKVEMQEDPANNNPDEIEEFKALCDIEAIGASCR